MNMIYLDNAATSFPKPRCVYEAVDRCICNYCGNPGRGSHPMALAAADKIYECREKLANYFHAASAEQIVFTLNATYALNWMIKGLLRPGDHVLISDMEHNAVWRPIERLARDGRISYDVFPTMVGEEDARLARNPTRICARIAARLKPQTRAVICSHQSNICSAHLPLSEIGAFCHRHHLLFLVDASQSAGHLPIDMQAMHIDGLCAPGHKGMYGIQGCGFAVLGERIVPDTLIEGGSGYASLDAAMPDLLPERGEAGTLPTPAIAGLCAGVSYLNRTDLTDVAAHERMLFRRLNERLQSLPNYHVYLPEHEGSTLMFHRDGIAADKIGQYLAHRGICVRTGYHCAALGHKTLRTPDGGGVRVSFGLFNRPRDVDVLYGALRDMEREMK
ncbi:MAG: aminotransferase class V-fold PLP-dependent enzyme [Clostridia bacterium]|nr:aminotransferase class V-fold PLP-dependent enzyme [Clostridia bacterium]